MLGERAELTHAAEVLVADMVRHAAVGDHARRHEVHAEVAQVLSTRDTPLAASARGDERHGDVVADRHARDALTHTDDLAGALVAADAGVVRHGQCTARHVLVGVAHAGDLGLHDDLAGAGVIDLDVFDRPLFADLPEHCCATLHETPSVDARAAGPRHRRSHYGAIPPTARLGRTMGRTGQTAAARVARGHREMW